MVSEASIGAWDLLGRYPSVHRPSSLLIQTGLLRRKKPVFRGRSLPYTTYYDPKATFLEEIGARGCMHQCQLRSTYQPQ